MLKHQALWGYIFISYSFLDIFSKKKKIDKVGGIVF